MRPTRRIVEMLREIAFAGEREIGRLKNISGRFTEWLDSHFTAISFAEVGEFDAARHFMGGGTGKTRRPVGCCPAGFCTGKA